MGETNAASTHQFHLVKPSPWPALGSLGLLILAIGAVVFMHDGPTWIALIGLAVIVFTLFGWWRDVISEAVVEKAHTERVRTGLRVGVVLFIISEVMFFVAFFWAFFHNAMQVNLTITQWPPEGIETLDAWGVPFLNTIILLSSGGTLVWASRALARGDAKITRLGIGLSILLGVLFLSLQIYEYGNATFGFEEGIFPTVFYMATGFHGFHVFVGVIFLTVTFLRASAGHFQSNHDVGFQAAEWYWHFVDVVWVFLFTWFYWWGGA